MFVEFFKLFLWPSPKLAPLMPFRARFVVEQAPLAPNSFAPDGQLFTCPFPACCCHHPECKQPQVWGCAVCHLQTWSTHWGSAVIAGKDGWARSPPRGFSIHWSSHPHVLPLWPIAVLEHSSALKADYKTITCPC